MLLFSLLIKNFSVQVQRQKCSLCRDQAAWWHWADLGKTKGWVWFNSSITWSFYFYRVQTVVVAVLPKTNSRNNVAVQKFSRNLILCSKRRCRYLQCQSSQSFQSGCNVCQNGEAACAPASGCPVLRQDTHAHQQVNFHNSAEVALIVISVLGVGKKSFGKNYPVVTDEIV